MMAGALGTISKKIWKRKWGGRNDTVKTSAVSAKKVTRVQEI